MFQGHIHIFLCLPYHLKSCFPIIHQNHLRVLRPGNASAFPKLESLVPGTHFRIPEARVQRNEPKDPEADPLTFGGHILYMIVRTNSW